MVGIYKITNPEGAVYIGQSHNITVRMRYLKSQSCSHPRKLFSSISKYGWENHIKEVSHELPKDVSQGVLDTYEKLYIDCYKDCGVELLNIREGGKYGKHDDESKTLMSYGNKGKKHSEETKQRMSESAKIRYTLNNPLKGRKLSEEAKAKRKLLNLGTGHRKRVIDTETGVIYASCEEAAKDYVINSATLSHYLVGTRKNKTSLKYYSDGR